MKQKLYLKLRHQYSKLHNNFTITHYTGALEQEMNSLESIKSSLNFGADIIEVDVSFRPDLIPVIIHKENPENYEGILFEEAIKIVSSDKKCRMNLDLKNFSNLQEIDKIINKYNMTSRVFYTGVTEDMIQLVKNNSIIPYYLNLELNSSAIDEIENPIAFAKKIKKLGAIGYNAHYNKINENLSFALRNEGLYLSIYTVNDIRKMKKVLSLYPDNITTLKPNSVQNFIVAEYFFEIFWATPTLHKITVFLFFILLILKIGTLMLSIQKKKFHKNETNNFYN